MSESEKNPAAEAAPVQAITVEHITALTAAIAALAESAKPAAPVTEAAPEAAPAAPETPEAPAVAEAAPVVSFEDLKRQVLADLRPQIVKEFGLPTRTGYRLTESADGAVTAEQERQEAWANRSALLLGDYGITPVPLPGTGNAQ